MKYLIIILVVGLASCASIPRPDLGKKKVAGKTYVAEQSSFIGIKSKPRWKVQPTQMDETRSIIRIPAKYTLYIALPLSILAAVICAVAVVYLHNERLAKICAVGAVSLFAASILAVAWLLATTWIWLFAVVIIIIAGGLIFTAYKVTKGQTIRLTRPGSQAVKDKDSG